MAALAAALETEAGASALTTLLLDDNKLERDAVWRLVAAAYDRPTLETVGLRGLVGPPLTEGDAARLRALIPGATPQFCLDAPLSPPTEDGAAPEAVELEAPSSEPARTPAATTTTVEPEDDEAWLVRLGHAELFC